MPHPDPLTRRLHVLLVCTGNVCRSPAMEKLMSHRFGDAVEVESAGTRALVGAGMPEHTIRALDRVGVPAGTHRARQLSPELVARADLVLAASRPDRAAAVRLVPTASAYAFTLPEFARLAADLGGAADPDGRDAVGPAGVVARVAARRGFVPPPAKPTEDDIADPFGRPFRFHLAAVERIARLVEGLAGAFALLEPRWPVPETGSAG